MRATKKNYSILLLIVSLLLCSICKAQPSTVGGDRYYVEHFGEDEGLPQNSINYILPDHNDFLWIATEGGIVRFNGNRFLSVEGTGNISGSSFTRVKNFYYKGKDTIIAYSPYYNRVAIIVNNKIVAEDEYQFHKYGLPPYNTPNAVPIPDYYLTHHGLNNSGFIKELNISASGISTVIYNQDTILVRTNSGIGIYTSKGKVGEIKLDIPDYAKVIFSSGQWFYLDKENYINFYSLSGFRKKELLNINAKNKLILFNNRFGNNFFCVADSDLYLVDVRSGTINFKKILSNLQNVSDIRTIYQKDSNTIITGTSRNGLYVYKKQFFKTSETLPAGESDVFYGQILLQDNETILAGKDNLFRDGKYLGKKGSGFKTDEFSCIKDSKGYYWYVLGWYLLRTREIGVVPDTMMIFTKGLIHRLLFEDKQGKIWAIFNNKFGYLSNNRFTEQKFSNLDPNIVSCMEQDITGKYWIGTRNGLFIFKGNQEREVQEVPGFELHDIRYIWPEANGQIWVCTYGQGFYLIIKNRVVSFPENKGMLSYVHCIIEDAKGYFWMPSNNGLFVTSRESLMEYVKNRKEAPFFYQFHKKHGFRTNEFNGGFLRLPDGRISLPSMQGLVSFNPAAINFNFSSSPILIDNIELDSSKAAEFNGFEISSKIRNISFTISSSLWGEKENNVLEYQVLEIEKSNADGLWLPVGSSGQINLYTPSDGNYLLVIRKRNGLKAGDYIYKEVNFRVLPKWYRTNAFLVAMLVALFLFMQGIFYFRRRSSRRAKRKLIDKVNAATLELKQLNDTLERKVVERTEIIRETETKFRMSFMTSQDAFYIGTLDGKIIDANDSFYSMYGYTKEETIGKTTLDLNLYADAEDRTKLVAELKANGHVKDFEANGRKKNGESMFISMTINLWVVNNEQIAMAVIRDITERKRSEAQIKESEENYRNIFDNALEGMYRTSIEGKCLMANPALAKIFGYDSAQEYINAIDDAALQAWVNPQDRSDYISLLKEQDIVKGFEAQVKQKDGTRIWIAMDAKIVRDSKGNYIYSEGFVTDINERKRIETELIEKKEQLTLFIEHSPASLAMFDTEMRYIATSRRWMNDYNLGNRNIIGKTHYEVFPEIGLEWKDIHQRCLKGAIERKEEDSFTRMDGTTDWLRWEIRPWHNSSGEIGGIIMFTEVITERILVRQKLIASEETRRHIINSAIDGIVGIDKKEMITIWTPQAEKIFGWKKDEALGKKMSDLIVPHQYRKDHERGLKHYLETGEGPILNKIREVTAIHRSGKEFPIELSIAFINQDENSFFCAFIRDISDRKLAEEKIKQSEEKNRALIENISDTIILINENLEVIYQSPSFVRTAGFNLEEMRGKTILDQIHPEDRQITKVFIEKSLSAPGVPIFSQIRINHKKGHYIWIEGTIINMLHNESVKALVVNYRDITERKNAEKQLKQLNITLEKRVGERTKELEVVNQELESFSYSISHDLRAPLRAINGYARILEEDFAETLNQEANGLINIIQKNSKRMGQLIDDLLAFSKLGRKNITSSEIDMNALIDSLIKEELYEKTENSQIIINNMLPAYGDVSLIKQVWINLLSNAYKYSGNNPSPVIEIGSSQTGNSMLYYIKDNGAGFDMQYYYKLFGVFQRLHSQEEFEGTGIGLAIIQKIVQKHKGSVWAESKLNEGSIFYFTLPIINS